MGLGGRTGSLGGRNPAIALTESEHAIVNRIQDEMIPSLRAQTSLENIKANVRALREAKRQGDQITDKQINDAAKRAVRFRDRMDSAGNFNN